MIGRLTRGEEEAGRAGAAPVAADRPARPRPRPRCIAVAGMDVVVGALVTLTLLVPGSADGRVGRVRALVRTARAALRRRSPSSPRRSARTPASSYGIAGAVLGASFVLRAVGDIGDGTVSWLSPIGWAQKARPFAGEEWWPFLVLVARDRRCSSVVAVALVPPAGRRRRLVAPRARTARRGAEPGPSRSGSPCGCSAAASIGWSAAVLLTGVAYGSIADSIDDFVKDNQALADIIAAQGGGSLADSYLAMSLRILALVGAGFAIQSALRLRSEETSLHAEHRAEHRGVARRWAASHLALAFGGIDRGPRGRRAVGRHLGRGRHRRRPDAISKAARRSLGLHARSLGARRAHRGADRVRRPARRRRCGDSSPSAS